MTHEDAFFAVLKGMPKGWKIFIIILFILAFSNNGMGLLNKFTGIFVFADEKNKYLTKEEVLQIRAMDSVKFVYEKKTLDEHDAVQTEELRKQSDELKKQTDLMTRMDENVKRLLYRTKDNKYWGDSQSK